MSSYLNASPAIIKAEVRLLLERMLAEPKTAAEKASVDAKLADVSLVIRAARGGAAVFVPMGWDDDQKSLYEMLRDFHDLV